MCFVEKKEKGVKLSINVHFFWIWGTNVVIFPVREYIIMKKRKNPFLLGPFLCIWLLDCVSTM